MGNFAKLFKKLIVGNSEQWSFQCAQFMINFRINGQVGNIAKNLVVNQKNFAILYKNGW